MYTMNQDVGYALWKMGYRVDSRLVTEQALWEKWDLVRLFADVTLEQFLKTMMDVHSEWFINEAEEEEQYRLENEPKLRKMFEDNFFGKTWAEIEEDPELYDLWGSYSDYHKDVYGYRPHGVVCGVYINPHA